jgi:hypothetical protein
MHYFTPELLLKLNSSDSRTVDQATECWEEAIRSYQKHLRKFRREMPTELQPLTELSLHDWHLVKIAPVKEGRNLFIAITDGGNLIFLWYLLTRKLNLIGRNSRSALYAASRPSCSTALRYG